MKFEYITAKNSLAIHLQYLCYSQHIDHGHIRSDHFMFVRVLHERIILMTIFCKLSYWL